MRHGHDLYRNLDLAHAHDLAHATDLELDRVRGLAAAAPDTEEVAGSVGLMPGRATRGLVALAVQMLPAAQRPRYRDEFRAELADLPRRERLGHARRVLARAWTLRRALIGAARIQHRALPREVER